MQRPDLVQIEAQLAHSARKRDNAEKIMAQVQKDADKLQGQLAGYGSDLQAVQKAADAAQGL